MKRQFAWLVALLLCVTLACSQREIKQYTIEQFMNTTALSGSSISRDDEYVLFSNNHSGIFNAYRVPVSGGEAQQLTDSKDNSIFAVSFFPRDDRILLRSDQGGNEIHHIYLREEDGSIKDLTPAPQARAVFYDWSFDEKSFFYGCNKRDPKFMDVYEMEIATSTPALIYQNDEGYNFGAISNDERYLALSKTITEHNSELYLYDRQTEELLHLTPHEGDVNYSPETFSSEGASLYYLTDEGSEFTYLNRYDLASRASQRIEEANWDIVFTSLSHNGRYRVIGINNDARTEIKIFDTQAGRYLELPKLPNAEITSVNISRSEKVMTFYVNGSRSPNNLHIYDLATGKFSKLTDSMNREIDQRDLVEAEVVRYKSFDGLEIPAIHYKPHLKKGERAPALVWVHGGPGGQSGVGYSALLQYLANHGYVVIAVNNRGSSGYGKSFFKMDDRKHGQDDLADCVAAKDFLVSTGYVDSAKIGIIGGSYGGYMVLAALAYQPQEFAVGVDIFGVSNWLRTLQSIPPWWEAFRNSLYEELGNPQTDPEYLRRISPLFHADQIVRPLIVLQGANDPRVLKAESDEIVAAVKKNGVPVEYIVFDDEGHGFVKKENQINGYRAILEFLDKHLRGQVSS